MCAPGESGGEEDLTRHEGSIMQQPKEKSSKSTRMMFVLAVNRDLITLLMTVHLKLEIFTLAPLFM